MAVERSASLTTRATGELDGRCRAGYVLRSPTLDHPADVVCADGELEVVLMLQISADDSCGSVSSSSQMRKVRDTKNGLIDQTVLQYDCLLDELDVEI
jgi:hypothetical protein